MKTGRCKYRWNPWKNTPVGWTCHHSQCLIYGLLLYLTNANKNMCCITFRQVHTKTHNVPRLGYLTDIQRSMALCVPECQKQNDYWWCYLVTPTEIHIVPELYVYLTPTATWSVSQLDITPAGAIPNQIYHTNVGQIFNSNRATVIWNRGTIYTKLGCSQYCMNKHMHNNTCALKPNFKYP